MKPPRAIVLSGYGLNCEDETKFAFDLAGARADIVHVNDLVAEKGKLKNYQILAIPGGFSYGDDTGSGKAYANKLKNHLRDELEEFVSRDRLVIGICNGFQILTNLGLLPGALLPNTSARYTVRWVDLKITGETPWLRGIKTLMVPIAHGEGRYYADEKTLAAMEKSHSIAAKYTKGEICKYQDLAANPNGAMKDIASIAARKGRILGTMPHPERAIFFTQLPHWPYLKEKLERAGKKLPVHGPGLQVFKNAVGYFK
ncbi:MAG: phosphoribosylformylglycinamidine synthase I [Minisyncoccia bacterium]|jgi:phosphoribosylformylglycinamidine synthase